MLDQAGDFTLYGDRWVVNVHGRQPAEKIARALHGTIG
jgi:hypothetical protein